MRRFLPLLMLVLLAAGCTGAPPSRPAEPPAAPPAPVVQPQPQPDPTPAPTAPPPIADLPGPSGRSPDDLLAALRTFANTGDGPLAARLTDEYSRSRLEPYPNAILVAEADLDGDGTPEVVTTPKYAHPIKGPGAVYVIYRKDGHYEVDRTPDGRPEMPRTGVSLYGLVDLTGDGRPEIVWSSSQLVAHSPPSDVFVSQWAPDRGFTDLPGAMGMINMDLTLDGRDLVLRGGGIGALSGMGQATRTDRYRWVNGAFRLVDRTLAGPKDSGYHWLMQGISDEDLGRPDRAAEAFRHVGEPDRPVIEDFTSQDIARSQELKPKFEAAVRTFARFRLGLLEHPAPADGPFAGLLQTLTAAADRQAACQAAAAWMKANPDFEQALNSLAGYAHPRWTPENICGSLSDADVFVSQP